MVSSLCKMEVGRDFQNAKVLRLLKFPFHLLLPIFTGLYDTHPKIIFLVFKSRGGHKKGDRLEKKERIGYNQKNSAL